MLNPGRFRVHAEAPVSQVRGPDQRIASLSISPECVELWMEGLRRYKRALSNVGRPRDTNSTVREVQAPACVQA
jgi:hypothetical protein